MFGMIAMYFAGVMLANAIEDIAQEAWNLTAEDLTNKNAMTSLLSAGSDAVIWGIVVVGGAGMIAAIVGNVSVGGFLLSAKSLQPKFSRMDRSRV